VHHRDDSIVVEHGDAACAGRGVECQNQHLRFVDR
jgi:hypothetical protein